MALFPGFLIIVPPLDLLLARHEARQGAAALADREPVNGWIALVLYLFVSPAMFAYLQVSLNHVWEQELNPAPGEKAPPRTDDGPMPPKLADAS